MGAYNNIYVGIYLEVKNGSKVQNKTIMKHPVTGKVQKNLDHKFSPQDGKEFIKEQIKETKMVYAQPYIEGVEGLCEYEFIAPAYTGMSDEEGRTFILNSSSSKYVSLGSDSDLFNLDLQDMGDIRNVLVEDFMLEYEPYLSYYRKHFGEVKVKYGIVHYAH